MRVATLALAGLASSAVIAATPAEAPRPKRPAGASKPK
jgi:hypothetical protein